MPDKRNERSRSRERDCGTNLDSPFAGLPPRRSRLTLWEDNDKPVHGDLGTTAEDDSSDSAYCDLHDPLSSSSSSITRRKIDKDLVGLPRYYTPSTVAGALRHERIQSNGSELARAFGHLPRRPPRLARLRDDNRFGRQRAQLDATWATRPFCYEELNNASTQIRLIQIEPSRNDSLISCSMSTHDVKTAPPYTAISYTWGDPSPSKRITLNGCSVEVRQNSFYALWQVRFYDMKMAWDAILNEALQNLAYKIDTGAPILDIHRSRPSKYYWMDAICIDQENLAEKSHQVHMMGDIFGRAANVAVSLGPEIATTQFLFDGLRTAPRESKPEAWRDWLGRLESEPGWQQLVAIGRALVDAGSIPYWSRMWIVQELLVARDATLCCGTQRIDWSLMHCFVKEMQGKIIFMNPSDDPVFSNSQREDLHDLLEHLNSMPLHQLVEMDKPRYSRFHYYAIQDFLQYRGTWRCTNVLDNIYAVLHLLSLQTPEKQVKPLIVDYTKSSFELALDAFDHILDSGGMSKGDEKARWTRALLNILCIDYYHPEVRRMIEQRQQNYREWLKEDSVAPNVRQKALRSTVDLANEIERTGLIPDGYHKVYSEGHQHCFKLQKTSDGHFSAPTVFHDDLSTEQDLSIAYEKIRASQLSPHAVQAVRQGSSTVALLCGRAKSGDWVIPFDRMMGRMKDERFYGCLVVRHARESLFEIVGQGLMEPMITACMAHSFCPRCPSMAQPSTETTSFKLFFGKEDLVAFGAQDLTLNRTSGKAFDGLKQVKQDFDRILTQPAERLHTSVTRSRFSSFAVGTTTIKNGKEYRLKDEGERLEDIDLSWLQDVCVKVIADGDTSAQLQTFIDALSKRRVKKAQGAPGANPNNWNSDRLANTGQAKTCAADHSIGTLNGKPLFGPQRPPVAPKSRDRNTVAQLENGAASDEPRSITGMIDEMANSSVAVVKRPIEPEGETMPALLIDTPAPKIANEAQNIRGRHIQEVSSSTRDQIVQNGFVGPAEGQPGSIGMLNGKPIFWAAETSIMHSNCGEQMVRSRDETTVYIETKIFSFDVANHNHVQLATPRAT